MISQKTMAFVSYLPISTRTFISNIPLVERNVKVIPVFRFPIKSCQGVRISATSTPQSADTPDILPASKIESLSFADRERVDNVREQLEFWFSAPNLRRDWYLRRQMDNDGWLDPSVFMMFNRIRKMRATVDDVILGAFLSEELEVSTPDSYFGDSAAQTRIRRSSLLPDFREWDDNEIQCSFILKCIPHDSTIDSIKEIFSPFATVTYVRVYRGTSPGMAPHALICFDSKEETEQVFEKFTVNAPASASGIVIRRKHLSPDSENAVIVARNTSDGNSNTNGKSSIPVVVLRISKLPKELDWKTLYQSLEENIFLRSNRRIRYMLYEQRSEECYLTISDAPAVRDMARVLCEKGILIDGAISEVKMLEDQDELNDYWKMAEEHQEQRRKKRGERYLSDTNAAVVGGNKKWPQGVVVKIVGLPVNLSWRTISSELSSLGTIVFLNHRRGSDTCFVRMSTPEEAAKICQSLKGDEAVPVAGELVDAVTIEGEEELTYWKQVAEHRRIQQVRLTEVESQINNMDDKPDTQPDSTEK